MDIKRDEMELIFNVLDSDCSGNVSYLEFCKNLGSFFTRDPVIMHSLVQCSILDLKKLVKEQVAAWPKLLTRMRREHVGPVRQVNVVDASCGWSLAFVFEVVKAAVMKQQHDETMRELRRMFTTLSPLRGSTS